MNKDIFFKILMLLSLIFINLDISLTWYALEVGYEEGNPILIKLMQNTSKEFTLIVSYFILLMAYLCSYTIYKKLKEEDSKHFLISIMFIMLGIRVYVVIDWVSILFGVK